MSLEKVDQCPICHGQQFSPLLVCKDHTTTGQEFHVEQCKHCGFVLTNPRPYEEQSAAYYQSASYISHAAAASGLLDYVYLLLRRFTIKWKYHLVKPYLGEKHLLDIGCGTGKFLFHCQQHHVDVYGVEPSAEARELALAIPLPIVDTLQNLPPVRFNVITLWHVLEHIYDLPKTLENLHSLLAENGIIFIAVPNCQSYDSTVYKEYWAGYDVPRHLWHFTKPTMQLLVEQAGMKVKNIIPMKLDAYYVSLLSEKYTRKKLTVLSAVHALWVGYRSNRKAKKTMNYSSLIYVVQR